MNKKGFTLMELIASIVIAAFIMMIIYPSITALMDGNNADIYSNYEKVMVEYVKVNEKRTTIVDEKVLPLCCLEDLQQVKDECIGYVKVQNIDGKASYKPYLKCGGAYETCHSDTDCFDNDLYETLPSCDSDVCKSSGGYMECGTYSILNETTQKCECISAGYKKEDDGKSCKKITCPSGQMWTENGCVDRRPTCGENAILNIVMNKCECKSSGYELNSNKISCSKITCPNGKEWTVNGCVEPVVENTCDCSWYEFCRNGYCYPINNDPDPDDDYWNDDDWNDDDEPYVPNNNNPDPPSNNVQPSNVDPEPSSGSDSSGSSSGDDFEHQYWSLNHNIPSEGLCSETSSSYCCNSCTPCANGEIINLPWGGSGACYGDSYLCDCGSR